MVYVETEEHSFSCKYDHVFPTTATQEAVYGEVDDCVRSFVEGYNSTLCVLGRGEAGGGWHGMLTRASPASFAYGQTGSGKTYTLFGPEDDPDVFAPSSKPSASSGVIPRAVRDVFAAVAALRGSGSDDDISLHCSFTQVYNECVYDLLRDGGLRTSLTVHEDSTNGIYVEGLSEFAVRSAVDCLALVRLGDRNRMMRQTHMNEHSSRSHAIFQIVVSAGRVCGERASPVSDECGAPNAAAGAARGLVRHRGAQQAEPGGSGW